MQSAVHTARSGSQRWCLMRLESRVIRYPLRRSPRAGGLWVRSRPCSAVASAPLRPGGLLLPGGRLAVPSPRQVVLVRGQMGEPYNLVGLPRAASDAARRCAAAGSALGVSRQQARARPRLLQCVISVSVSCQVIQPGSECCVSHPVPGSPWQVQQAACRRRAALRRLHRLPQPSLPLQVPGSRPSGRP